MPNDWAPGTHKITRDAECEIPMRTSRSTASRSRPRRRCASRPDRLLLRPRSPISLRSRRIWRCGAPPGSASSGVPLRLDRGTDSAFYLSGDPMGQRRRVGRVFRWRTGWDEAGSLTHALYGRRGGPRQNFAMPRRSCAWPSRRRQKRHPGVEAASPPSPCRRARPPHPPGVRGTARRLPSANGWPGFAVRSPPGRNGDPREPHRGPVRSRTTPRRRSGRSTPGSGLPARHGGPGGRARPDPRVMHLASRRDAPLGPSAIAMVQAVGGLVGVALENAALRELMVAQQDRLRGSRGRGGPRAARRRRAGIAHELHDASPASSWPRAHRPGRTDRAGARAIARGCRGSHGLLRSGGGTAAAAVHESFRPTILDDLGLGPRSDVASRQGSGGANRRIHHRFTVTPPSGRLPSAMETASTGSSRRGRHQRHPPRRGPHDGDPGVAGGYTQCTARRSRRWDEGLSGSYHGSPRRQGFGAPGNA